nr:type II toxin-antitoxin system VapC family toxin [Actinomycetales bacterium]
MGQRLILDTNVLVALDRGALDWQLFEVADLAVPAIVVAELRVGVALAASASVAQDREIAVSRILGALGVLDYTEATAGHHARLIAHCRQRGAVRGAHDLILAAHAAETGRLLVSHDAAARFGDLPGVRAIAPTAAG